MDLVTLLKFVAGFGMLILGAELLVRGAARLAEAAGISPLVVGLTVVAYGTSAPELAVTLQATCEQPPQPDLAIGNVVGSNISNVLLVLGIAALVAPLTVARQIIRSNLPLMIGVSFLLLLLGWDAQINRWEGCLLFLGAVAFTAHSVISSRREVRRTARKRKPQRERAARVLYRLLLQLALIAAGLAMLVLAANWLIDGAVQVAAMLGVSKLVIGLTIVAVGTSLPEIATSVVASLRGQRDLAVGNVVGSNIFNILLVLGLTAIAAPDGIAVSSKAMRCDIPIMIAAALGCLPICYTGYRISRGEAAVLLAYYVAYTLFLFMRDTDHSAAGLFSGVMMLVIAPVTAVALLLLTWQAIRKGNPSVS